MRNLVRFIIRYHAFFLFIILEVCCIALIMRTNRFNSASIFNSTNSMAGKALTLVSDAESYLSLRKENEELAAENAQLRAKLHNVYEWDTAGIVTINDTLRRQVYQYIPARVTRNSVHKPNNYFHLNKGKRQGVEPGWGVISLNGSVVGIIKAASKNYSMGISLLNSHFNVWGRHLPSGETGRIRWDNTNPSYGYMSQIGKHIPLSKGDSIVTTGFSDYFPEGLLIGRIDTIFMEPGRDLYEVRLELGTNFRGLDNVYVVKDIYRQEKLTLEAEENDQ